MPENLEIKIKVNSHSDLLTRLELIGAEHKGLLIQKDVYYRVKKQLIKLRLQNTGNELIRYNRNEKSRNRFSTYEVLHISSDKPEKFFDTIFIPECIVNKKRELWIYDYTRIHLDIVKDLGKFIELETLVLYGKKDAKERFDKMIELLGLHIEKQIRASYRDLILGKMKPVK